MRPMALSIVLLALAALSGCGNPFPPDKQAGAGEIQGPAPDATTPEILMDNLARAMRDRDKDGNVEVCLAGGGGILGKFDVKACLEIPGPNAMPKPRPNVAGFSLRGNR